MNNILFALRIRRAPKDHPVWRAGSFLRESPVDHEEIGPSVPTMTQVEYVNATFYTSHQAIHDSLKEYWSSGYGCDLEIVTFKEANSQRV